MESIQLILLLVVCVGLVYVVLKNRRYESNESEFSNIGINKSAKEIAIEVEAERSSKELNELTQHRPERIQSIDNKIHNFTL